MDLDKTNRLVQWVGVVILTLGLIDFIGSFLASAGLPDFISLLIYISVGVGMFEKFGWSRILGILLSVYQAFASGLGILVYSFPNPYSSFNPKLNPQLALALLGLNFILHGLMLYIYFRSDVKELFKSQSR